MTTTTLGHVVSLLGRLDDNNSFINSSMVHKGKRFAFTKPEKETTMHISIPVSYTHLDVYKRQGIFPLHIG